MVRAKFSVSHKSPEGLISMAPVYTGSEENKAFFQATPSGQVVFYATKPEVQAQFEVGKEYYVDFTPA
jgi:hypothetical protein